MNLNMKGNKLVLPLETVYHDRIYTYMHSSNTLYRGKIPIKAPAVGALPCSHPHTMPHQNPSENATNTADVRSKSKVAKYKKHKNSA